MNKELLKEDKKPEKQFNKDIRNYDNYVLASDFIKKILKDKDKAEALKRSDGDFEQIKKNLSGEDTKKIIASLLTLQYNAALNEKTAKSEGYSKIPSGNVVQNSKELLDKTNVKYKEDLNKESFQEIKNNFVSLLPKEQEPPQETTQKVPQEIPDEDNNEEEPEEETQETNDSDKEESGEYKYAGNSPKEISAKIQELIDQRIKSIDEKIAITKDNNTKKILEDAKNKLLALNSYSANALKQEKKFSVYPTPSSKQSAMTNAQIAYNTAVSKANIIANKISSKELGSYASLYAKSAGEALKRTGGQIKSAVEKSRALNLAKDAAGKVISKIKTATPGVQQKVQTAATQTAGAIKKWWGQTPTTPVRTPYVEPTGQKTFDYRETVPTQQEKGFNVKAAEEKEKTAEQQRKIALQSKKDKQPELFSVDTEKERKKRMKKLINK